jgi:hypothetical protein
MAAWVPAWSSSAVARGGHARRSDDLHVGRGEQHQLGVAIRRLPDGNPMKAMMLRYEDLTRFATTFRYPTPLSRLKQAED